MKMLLGPELGSFLSPLPAPLLTSAGLKPHIPRQPPGTFAKFNFQDLRVILQPAVRLEKWGSLPQGPQLPLTEPQLWAGP